ncbi:hypothetical protein J7E62_24505 [Variovorax paradoxus]|nr:hypothetical protein [Variovorax paradoxus]
MNSDRHCLHRLTAATVLAALALCANATGDWRFSNSPVMGDGNSTCSQWLDARSSKALDLQSEMRTWVQGYLSALASQRINDGLKQVPMPDIQTLTEMMLLQCNYRPDDRISEAAYAMWKYLARDK